jgi:two-component system KDP operon response regulator KdpE
MSGTVSILVVDDEPSIRRLLTGCLERAGYRALQAADARAALASVHIDKPDAVLLDLGLPDRDGLELVPLIRSAGVAVLVVSARDVTAEKVAALDLGADDYVTKPFDTEEVLARIRSALRDRARQAVAEPKLVAGRVEIDLDARQVRRQGVEVHLTPREYEMLAELARRPGKVVTHAHLLAAVWGPGHENDVEYLRVAARSLRKKLEEDPSQPRLICNELGVGYRLMTDT